MPAAVQAQVGMSLLLGLALQCNRLLPGTTRQESTQLGRVAGCAPVNCTGAAHECLIVCCVYTQIHMLQTDQL